MVMIYWLSSRCQAHVSCVFAASAVMGHPDPPSSCCCSCWKCCWRAAFSQQPFVMGSSSREPPSPVNRNHDWWRWIHKGCTVRTALMGHLDSRAPFGLAEAVPGLARQTDFSLCPILLPSPPFIRVLSQFLFLKRSYVLNAASRSYLKEKAACDSNGG